MDMGGDILDDITRLGDVTILAPSNEAWDALNVQNVIRYVNFSCFLSCLPIIGIVDPKSRRFRFIIQLSFIFARFIHFNLFPGINKRFVKY